MSKEALTRKIKLLVNQYVGDRNVQTNLSDYLVHYTKYNYTYLSQAFSSREGLTIAQYHIKLRIELVKELLLFRTITLSRISHVLGYRSISHLSNQFKRVTGLTPTAYRQKHQRLDMLICLDYHPYSEFLP